MVRFIKKHKKLFFLLFVIFVFSIGSFLISYFNKKDSDRVIDYSLKQCDTNTGYSVAYDVKADYHKNKTISHILVEGAKEEKDNTYRREDEEITVYHALDTDINNLFDSKNKISYDTWDGEVFSADFKGEKIGRGAIFIEVVYWDDFGLPQTEIVYYTDVLNGAVNGDIKELIKIEKKECDIRILLVYKVIDKYGTSSEDFRINYLLKIRNGTKDEVYPVSIEYDKNGKMQDIKKGGTVYSGFWLDFTGNQFYTVEVYRNGDFEGIYDYITIRVRSRFTDEGFYKIITKNAFGEEDEFFIIVDRYIPAGKFKNLDLDGHNTFTNFTAFMLDEPLGGFDNRSPVTMKIRKGDGEYVNYSSGEIIREVGCYSIWLENDLFTNIIYDFEIVNTILPDYNYKRLVSFEESLMPARYYGVSSSDNEITTFCFANYNKALEKAMELEQGYVKDSEFGEIEYEYRGKGYSSDELELEILKYAKQNVKLRYTDIDINEKLIFDREMFNSNEIPYLNDFTFTSLSPILSDTIYYLRLENFVIEPDESNALNLAKSSKNILKYDIPVNKQLTLSGTYLIFDINIYGQIYAFKAYFVNENNAKIKIDYSVNQVEWRAEITADKADKNELSEKAVNYFRIGDIDDKFDVYTIVRVTFGDCVDYYTAYDLETGVKKYYDIAGVYQIVCYDRNFNSFKFEITVKNLDSGIRLEGVENNLAYDAFQIYFNIDCVKFIIKEGSSQILLIENGNIKTNYYGLQIFDSTDGLKYITIKKESGIWNYSIFFEGKNGNTEEFLVTLI